MTDEELTSDFAESMLLEDVTTGALLHAGVVSELSSSGLLLSSVSFPLLPKLHPLLSLSGDAEIFLVLRRDIEGAVYINVFLVPILFFPFTRLSFGFEDVILDVFVDI